jgi:hypothetical protein
MTSSFGFGSFGELPGSTLRKIHACREVTDRIGYKIKNSLDLPGYWTGLAGASGPEMHEPERKTPAKIC